MVKVHGACDKLFWACKQSNNCAAPARIFFVVLANISAQCTDLQSKLHSIWEQNNLKTNLTAVCWVCTLSCIHSAVCWVCTLSCIQSAVCWVCTLSCIHSAVCWVCTLSCIHSAVCWVCTLSCIQSAVCWVCTLSCIHSAVCWVCTLSCIQSAVCWVCTLSCIQSAVEKGARVIAAPHIESDDDGTVTLATVQTVSKLGK